MKTTALSKLPFLLIIVVVAVLVIATFVEHRFGSAVAYAHIYHSLAFRLLWAALAVAGTWLIVRKRLWRRPVALLLHAAFLVILAGALTTSLTSTSGMLHLRKGETTRTFFDDRREVHTLPFEVTLTDFRVQYSPGTNAPRDYESRLRVGGAQPMVVAMNRIGRWEGHRFYQSSYDDDLEGAVLTVTYDPYGILLTYMGYGLLLLAMFWLLVDKHGRFRTLLRHPALRRSAFVVLGVIGATLVQPLHAAQLPTIPRTQADSLMRRQVVYNNRVCPVNTLAIDFCKKLYGRPTFRHLSAEQVLFSWLFYPEAWQDVPMLKIKSSALRQRLGIEGDYARLSQLYDGTTYRLQAIAQGETDPNSPLSRAVQELDEKVGLILMLHKGTLIVPVDARARDARLSPLQVDIELLYNRLDVVKWGFMLCLTFGFVGFATLVGGVRRRWWALVQRLVLLSALIVLLSVFAFRWYLGGFVPLSNGFETMLFMAICTLVLALPLGQRFPFALSFGFLLAGFSLLVAHLGNLNPQITPLMPVLTSPLLSVHVTIVMLSYALFALMAMNSLYALWLLHRSHPLSSCWRPASSSAPSGPTSRGGAIGAGTRRRCGRSSRCSSMPSRSTALRSRPSAVSATSISFWRWLSLVCSSPILASISSSAVCTPTLDASSRPLLCERCLFCGRLAPIFALIGEFVASQIADRQKVLKMSQYFAVTKREKETFGRYLSPP